MINLEKHVAAKVVQIVVDRNSVTREFPKIKITRPELSFIWRNSMSIFAIYIP